MDIISSTFQFYFEDWPENEQDLGQVMSTCNIVYNINSPSFSTDTGCVLFLRGVFLEEIFVYIPNPLESVIRELHYFFKEKSIGRCTICFEDSTQLRNVHDNEETSSVPVSHQFCLTCITKLSSKQCPMCRMTIV